MSLNYLGSLTLGAAIPGALVAINAALPDLQAQVDALLTFQPPAVSFAAQLELALQMAAAATAAIELGIQPPTLDAQLAIIAEILGQLQARLTIVLGIKNMLAAAGLHAWSYTGVASGLGSSLADATANGLPGGQPTDQTAAIVIAGNVTVDPTIANALSELFAGF